MCDTLSIPSTWSTSIPDWHEQTQQGVAVSSPVPIASDSGVLKEFPALGKYGVGLIETEGTKQVVSFHVRDLMTGGEDCLEVGTRATFGLMNGRAINVRLNDVATYSGLIREYSQAERTGIIVDNDSSRCTQMRFDGIFRKLPHTIEPCLHVTCTLGDCELTAKNVRFADLEPNSGRVVRFLENSGCGEIKPDSCEMKVIFHTAGVRHQDGPDTGLLQPGTRVTYDLERKFSKGKGQNKASKVEATNIAIRDPSLAVIQPVHHVDAAGLVPGGLGSVHWEPSRARAATSPVHPEGQVVHLHFPRNPKELHRVLQVLELPGVPAGSRLSCSAYVFAPSDFHAVFEGRSQELELGHSDVIVTAELEQLVMAEIGQLPREVQDSCHALPGRHASRRDACHRGRHH